MEIKKIVDLLRSHANKHYQYIYVVDGVIFSLDTHSVMAIQTSPKGLKELGVEEDGTYDLGVSTDMLYSAEQQYVIPLSFFPNIGTIAKSFLDYEYDMEVDTDNLTDFLIFCHDTNRLVNIDLYKKTLPKMLKLGFPSLRTIEGLQAEELRQLNKKWDEYRKSLGSKKELKKPEMEIPKGAVPVTVTSKVTIQDIPFEVFFSMAPIDLVRTRFKNEYINYGTMALGKFDHENFKHAFDYSIIDEKRKELEEEEERKKKEQEKKSKGQTGFDSLVPQDVETTDEVLEQMEVSEEKNGSKTTITMEKK